MEKDELLFFKIWRNNYLNNIIFNFINLLNIYKNERILTISELEKEIKNNNSNCFLNSIIIEINNVNDIFKFIGNDDDQQGDEAILIKIPFYIKTIKIIYKLKENLNYFQMLLFKLPNHLKISIKFKCLSSSNSSLNSPPISLPNNIVKLEFEPYLLVLPDGFLPEQLETSTSPINKLKLSIKQPIPKKLPISIKTLVLYPNSRIGDDIEFLKSLRNLEKLTIGPFLNQPLDFSILPWCLKKLTLNTGFEIKPYTLYYLKIVELRILNDYDHQIQECTLPDTLEYLEFTGWNYEIKKDILPKKLKTLKLLGNFNKTITPNTLPPSLTSLHFNYRYNCEIQPNTLPNQLLELNLYSNGYKYIFKEQVLPSNLKKLSIFSDNLLISSSSSPPKSILHSLTHLSIEQLNNNLDQIITTIPNLSIITILKSARNEPIHNYKIPKSVTKLELSNQFNIPFAPNDIPNHIKSLVFGNSFNDQIVLNSLPTQLESITFGDQYNQPFIKSSLPNSITQIKFNGYYFNQILSLSELPLNLKILFIGNSNPLIIDYNDDNESSSLKALIVYSTNFKFLNQNSIFLKNNLNILKVIKDPNYK